ncbi:NifB/NifX family molybdenum-iron cluster-binding protein [Marinospirillum sp.]|uniref:NifB/NifX family molybdenum-iron cluster-binding protein n=1 Tax=Marinospirillum sp. TaxID=2183934 RepID=UPI00286FBE01|nr:NifB/NifX family molybdenum-iron cluster-binding protein [Marinospirillum sp.]MDR9467078.1 NifB/NifX family molybdenum-iron cluster-binding protein [Marinospirillum sp.]
MRHLKLVSQQKSAEPHPQLKVAFASSDRKTVNQHFGAAQAFVIYDISSKSFQLAEVVEFSGQATAQDGQEDKLESKIKLLEACSAVYCTAVGASAIRQLLAVNIQPLKVEEQVDIETQLKELLSLWSSKPPTWLQRSLRQLQKPAAEERFAEMASEGWVQEEWSS